MSEDFALHLVERYVYSPYGELTVHQSTGYGDRDGDGNVNSTDKGTPGTTCTGTVSGSCRILDLDFDGGERSERERAAIGKASTTRASGPRARPEPANTKRAGGGYDSTDAGKFDSLAQGLQRNPGRLASAVQQPFAHQGLLFEPEIGSFQNRVRLYAPGKKRFAQRDPYFFAFADGPNLYSYTRENPIAQIDPSGFVCSGWAPTGPAAPTTTSAVRLTGGGVQCFWQMCQSFTRVCTHKITCGTTTYTDSCMLCGASGGTTVLPAPAPGPIGPGTIDMVGFSQFCPSRRGRYREIPETFEDACPGAQHWE